MSFPEAILLFVALLLPFFGYLFFRGMRAIQRDEIEARHDRLYRDALELMEPEDREEFLRSVANKASTSKPE
jgi:hypothetical protein